MANLVKTNEYMKYLLQSKLLLTRQNEYICVLPLLYNCGDTCHHV
jgi:hypothetical protein